MKKIILTLIGVCLLLSCSRISHREEIVQDVPPTKEDTEGNSSSGTP